MVTFLTPDDGKINVLFRGCQRPKSFVLGQYDLFYTCEVIYYRRPQNDMQLAKECYPLKMRTRFRTDWQAMALASYWVDLMDNVCPYAAVGTDIYRFCEGALDVLAKYGARQSLLHWLELNLLEKLGFAPQLQCCAICRADSLREGRGMFVDLEQGGLVCERCAEPRAGMWVGRDVIATLRGWQKARQELAATATQCSPAQLQKIGEFLWYFLDCHLDVPLTSRRIALAMQGMTQEGRS